MKEFRDRVAVVTGAASGIGKAMAERFAGEGMKVVMADVEGPALDAAARELEDKGALVLPVLTDVSNAESVEALAERAFGEFGAVHLLCNNAGVGGGRGCSGTARRRTGSGGWASTSGASFTVSSFSSHGSSNRGPTRMS